MSVRRRHRQRPWAWPVQKLVVLGSIMMVLGSCQATAEVTMSIPPESAAQAERAPALGPSVASPTEIPAANAAPLTTPPAPVDEADQAGDAAADNADGGGTAAGDSGRQSPLDDQPDRATNGGEDGAGGTIDFTLERDDIDCEEETLNEYSEAQFTVAHVVVDGILGAPCFGEPDDRLTESWRVLSAITPPDQLRDLGLFGGFDTSEDGEITLAFVNALDTSGSLFQMSINLEQAEADPDEMMLTMAHEFAHVFTSTPSQLDRDVRQRDCTTFYNGEGCFLADSLIAEWVELFWDEALIADFDPFDEPSNDTGEDRCAVDGGFLGPYAASHPEEDFAEAFSAFVFQLEVDTPGLQARMDWFAGLPGLVEFRDRAMAAGFGPLQNFFLPCGG